MKKLLNLIVLTILASGLGLNVTACRNPLAGSGNGGEVKPPTPPIKNINYYQNLIKETEGFIADCNQILKEIEENKNDYDSEKEYQSAIDEVTAEQYFYQALINEYQYQILLLEKQGNKFNASQVLQGIVIFTAKTSNLKQELKLKEKYPDYYTKQELQVIKDAIAEAKIILKMFQNLKEEKE